MLTGRLKLQVRYAYPKYVEWSLSLSSHLLVRSTLLLVLALVSALRTALECEFLMAKRRWHDSVGHSTFTHLLEEVIGFLKRLLAFDR